jgi:hypothetical protein
VGDGLLEEARGDVKVVEARRVTLESVDVVTNSKVTITVFLEMTMPKFGGKFNFWTKNDYFSLKN